MGLLGTGVPVYHVDKTYNLNPSLTIMIYPYSRRRLREAPEEVNELVTREIERRIADGQISRAQCMDTHWDWLKHAVLDAAAEAAPVRSGRRPMKPGFDVRRQTRCADDDRRDLDLELRGLANGSS